MEAKYIATVFLTLIVLTTIPLVSAQEEDEDIEILGLELEKLIAMANALIAIFLFTLAIIAYKRDGRKRLFWVALAFLLFAIKSLLISSELYMPEVDFFDPLATILELGMILSFFYGVLKK